MTKLMGGLLALLLFATGATAAPNNQPGDAAELSSPAVNGPFGETLRAMVAAREAEKKAKQVADWRKLLAQHRQGWVNAGPSHWDSRMNGNTRRAYWDAELAFPRIKALLEEKARLGFEEVTLVQVKLHNMACRTVLPPDYCSVYNALMPSLPKGIDGADLNQYYMDFTVWINARFEDEVLGYSFNNPRGTHEVVARWKAPLPAR